MADQINFTGIAGTNNIDFTSGGIVVQPIAFTGTVNLTGATGPQGNIGPVGPPAIDATFTTSGSTKKTVFNVRDYGAKGDGRITTDAVISASSTTVTSSTGAFSTADNGKRIMIIGAGPVSGAFATPLPLYGTFTYVSSTTGTVSVAATTSVTSATFYVGSDDTTAINQAIVAANANPSGGKVYFSPALYLTSGQIFNLSNTTLYCDTPGGAVIQGVGNQRIMGNVASGSTKNLYTNIGLENIKISSDNKECFYLSNTSNVYIKSPELTFVSTTFTAESLIMEYCEYLEVDAYIHDNPGDGIQINACDHWNVNPSIIINSRDDAIDIDGDFLHADTMPSTHGTITSPTIDGVSNGSGIRVETSSNVAIVGGSINNVSGGAGVNINTADGNSMVAISVTGTEISNCTDQGVLVANSAGATLKYVNLVGLVITNSGQAGGTNLRGGIVLATDGVNVVGSTLANCGKTGTDGGAIIMYKTVNHNIADNFIQDSVGYGINAWNGNGTTVYTNVNVTNNKMSGNGTDYNSDILTQPGITLAYFGAQKYVLQGLQITGGTPALGSVLTSDASGNATWQLTTGNVTGPASSTANAIATFNGTTGKIIQNSIPTINSTGGISTTIAVGGNTKGLSVTQNDTTNNQNAVAIVNAGSGASLAINNNFNSGTAQPAFSVTDLNTTGGNQTVRISSARGGGVEAVRITMTGAGDALAIDDGTTTNFKVAKTGTITLVDSANLVLATAIGTKIGTSTSQKLGFFNATPVVQQTGDVLTALQTLGLVSSGTISQADITGLTATLALLAPLASPTFSGTVTVPSTVNATDAAQKAYVDSVAQGLSVKTSVQEATAAALPTNTYLSGVITVTATGTLTVDGVVVALNDRVLVKNEVAAANNGIYLCTTAGSIGVAAVLTRATDSNTGAKILGGFTFVETGTVNAAAGFVNTNATAPTIGTTSITYTQFSGAGEIIAGTGILKSGNTLSIDSTVATLSGSQALTNKDLTGSGNSFPTFNQSTTGNAATVTTNANLTGPITSSGNATSIASQTGTGTTFVMSASPTLTGTALATNLTTSGAVTHTVAAAGNQIPLTINQNDVTNNPSAAVFNNAGTGNTVKIVPTGNTGTTVASSGSILLDNTANTGIGLNVYSNQAAGTAGALVNVNSINHSSTQPIMSIITSAAPSGTDNIVVQHAWNLASGKRLMHIENSGNFATAGDLVYLELQNATDSGRPLVIANAGTGSSFAVTSNALTNANVVSLSSSSTAGTASSTSFMLNLSRSGANANLAHTAYGISSAVTNTNATSGTNIAGYFSASGATTANYGLIVAAGSVGIGTATPTSQLHVNGPIATAYVAKTATYTVTATDSTIDCTANTFTVTLPTAAGITGRQYTVKNSGTGVITIATTSAQTIDASTTLSLATQYKYATVISDGANWKIIANN